MPHIQDAMLASLRHGLSGRDIASEASSVQHSFSSWDNCMAATYCKWPVIAAIIVASLIVLSVVWCIVRCACCGLSCCCSCFSCLKCCGDCCGCCDPPGGRRQKHVDEPYYNPNRGYQTPTPMMAGGMQQPQYAHFETGPSGLAVTPARNINDDALPPMPSWDTAARKKIVTEEEERETVELGELDPTTGQKVPLMSGAHPISRTQSPALPSQIPYRGPTQPSPYSELRPSDQSGFMAGSMVPTPGARVGMTGQGPRQRLPTNNDPVEMGAEPVSSTHSGLYNAHGLDGYNAPYSPPLVSPMDAPAHGSYDQYSDITGYGANTPEVNGFGRADFDRAQPQAQRIYPESRPHMQTQRQYTNTTSFNVGPAQPYPPTQYNPNTRSTPIQQYQRPSPPRSQNSEGYGGSTAPPSYMSRTPAPAQMPVQMPTSHFPSYTPYQSQGQIQQQSFAQGRPARERDWSNQRQGW